MPKNSYRECINILIEPFLFFYFSSGKFKNSVNEQLSNPIYRVSGAGENVGLHLRIEIEKESYVAYSKSFYGAKILIHDAENFPQTSVTTTTIGQPGYDLTIAVIPSVIVSEPGIRSLSEKQRNCLFDDEVNRLLHVVAAVSNKIFSFLCIAKIANHQQIQFPVMHDWMHGEYDSGQMRLLAILLSRIRWLFSIHSGYFHWPQVITLSFSQIWEPILKNTVNVHYMMSSACETIDVNDKWLSLSNDRISLIFFIVRRCFFKLETTGQYRCVEREQPRNGLLLSSNMFRIGKLNDTTLSWVGNEKRFEN